MHLLVERMIEATNENQLLDSPLCCKDDRWLGIYFFSTKKLSFIFVKSEWSWTVTDKLRSLYFVLVDGLFPSGTAFRIKYT